MTQPKSILILGAGELGLEVIKSVAQHNLVKQNEVPITVLLRPSGSSNNKDTATIESLGCRIIRHDIGSLDVAGLADILAPYDAVVSCTGFAAGPGTQLKITKAALAAKVGRFFPWQFGIDYDAIGRGSGQALFDEQLDVRDLLRAQSEVDWIIVSTGVFMSFVFEDAFGILEGAKDRPGGHIRVRALGTWENGLSVTSVEDIGSLTVALLFDVEVNQQVVHVAGDTFTYARLADMVEKVRGSPVERELWATDHLSADLQKAPDDTMRRYRVAFAAGRGVMWEHEKTYNARKGIQTCGIEQWMGEHLP